MPTKATSRPSGDVEVKAKNANADDRKFIDKHKSELSKTTLRAKWIHNPNEHEDRPGQTLATRSPDVVRAWAQSRKGEPSTTASIPDGERPRTLRFDFPANGQNGDGRGRRLKHIRWEDWLSVFNDRKLVFLYQEHRRDGGDSNFFRLDSPEREEG